MSSTTLMAHPLEEVVTRLASFNRGADARFYVDIQQRDEHSASLKVTQGPSEWFQVTSFVDLTRADQDTTRASFKMAHTHSTWIVLRGLGLMAMAIIASVISGQRHSDAVRLCWRSFGRLPR